MKIILKRISLFGALALAAILLMSCRASPDVAELEVPDRIPAWKQLYRDECRGRIAHLSR